MVSQNDWTKRASSSILFEINHVLSLSRNCNVILTGGQSVVNLYKALSARPEFQSLTKVNFYFGDERCVPEGDLESNYSLVMRTLFAHGIPRGCTLNRINIDLNNLVESCLDYENRLPKKIDILLVSVGEDGHIASIFPDDFIVLNKSRRQVVSVCGPKYPHQRITITPSVIMKAKKVFVLAIGLKKIEIFWKIRSRLYENKLLPASLVINGIWFMDEG